VAAADGVAAADDLAAASAAALAAFPSGLAAENPGLLAEASPESQFSETSSWFVAEPPVFSGGGTVRDTVLVTKQSGQAFWSPTVVETTGVIPAPLMALWASLYFCPTTSGAEVA
jgi:hypothetical protein